ncbi:MAG: protein kinase [Candidatus Pacebacteria bacterium]|nr:protein kinase [Candidatus Paceibacterota bacterium]
MGCSSVTDESGNADQPVAEHSRNHSSDSSHIGRSKPKEVKKREKKKKIAEPEIVGEAPGRSNTAKTGSTTIRSGMSRAEEEKAAKISLDLGKLVTERFGSVVSRYKEIKSLGKGAYGEVKMVAENTTNQMMAMKVIPKKNCSRESTSSLLNEIDVLKKLDHPNILKVYEFYQDEQNYYIIMEYCAGGELFDRIVSTKHYTEAKAAFVMKQLLSAIAYCHKLNIVHR